MIRRTLLAALMLAVTIPAARAQLHPPTAADAPDIARAEDYLNSIRSLKARFLQVAPDGATAGGQAWLVRPGKMRFQYDPPSPLLLVAGHGLVVFHDDKLKQTSNIPIGQTPLGLLLQDHLKLSGDVTVTGLSKLPGELRIALVRTRTPGDGTLILTFADNPLMLRQWSVIDPQRQETRVTLSAVELGGSYDQKLFEFVDPRFFQGNDAR